MNVVYSPSTIAVSTITADRLGEIGPDRKRIDVVPNGIDVERISSIEPAADGFDVLYAGRLIEDKHVDRLIDAFEAVTDAQATDTADAAADPGPTLGIVGDGPQRDALERQVERSDASDRITTLGFLEEYEDVLAHMSAAAIFASPSTREGFGITYLEAMAADCTVIGVDHPDSAASEVIDDGGFLVGPSTDALTDALGLALAGERPPTEPTEIAAEYDWDAIAQQAEAAYRSALE